MRTVTFSDPATAAFMNEHVVASWENHRPRFHNCDPGEEREIGVLKSPAFGTKNITSFVLDPQGRVVHYFSGYLEPARFRDELEFSLRLWRELMDEKGNARRDGSERYLRLHQERLERRRDEAKGLAAEKVAAVPEGLAADVRRMLALFGAGKGPRTGHDIPVSEAELAAPGALLRVAQARRDHLAAALEGLARTHQDLMGKVRLHGRLELLRKTGYRYGDDFAEE